MKIIFDFDDVLLDNASLKAKIFSYLEKQGINKEECVSLYTKHRADFSLEKMYSEYVAHTGKSFSGIELEEFRQYVLSECETFLHKDLLAFIEKIGKENCFVLTAGNSVFQNEKIQASGLYSYIQNDHVYIVKEDKNEILSQLCNLYSTEPIIFVDDKEIYIEKARLLPFPNLHAVLYDEKHGCATLSDVVHIFTE